MLLTIGVFLQSIRKFSQFQPIHGDNGIMKVISISNDAVSSAVDYLKNGNLIALPTDTVYGIAADSRNSSAIEKIYKVKGRDFNKPLAICVSDIDVVHSWGDTSNLPPSLLSRLLPGPVTVLLKRTDSICCDLNPGVSKVGIRVPDSNFIRAVARNLGSAIALTSANLSNEQSTLSPSEFQHLWHLIDAVFDGGKLSDSEHSRTGSTIIDLSLKGKFRIVRPGHALSNTLNIIQSFGLLEF